MKTWFVAPMTIMLALASTPARAQQPPPAPPPAPAPSPVLTVLLEGITLTPEQQHKVDSILTHFRTQVPPLKPDTEPDSATRRRILALSQVALDGIRNVLTRAQQQVWDLNAERAKAASLRVGP
jgi:hypothetical protein